MPRSDASGGDGPRPEISEDLEGHIAEAMFSEFGGESKAWQYLISRARRRDARLTFDILRYWTDRKYGKPSQRVHGETRQAGWTTTQCGVDSLRRHRQTTKSSARNFGNSGRSATVLKLSLLTVWKDADTVKPKNYSLFSK
jgi:hypothetical protein